MKVAITGHTRGIGEEIYNYFTSEGHECFGFSRSTGYDIDNIEHRQKIIDETKDFDVFVNNACNRVDDSQLFLLQELYEKWKDQSKIIINIGSRAGDFVDFVDHPHHNYFLLKNKQDKFCATKNNKVWLINLRPGTVETPVTKDWQVTKMKLSVISNILDYTLKNHESFKIKSITFGL